MISLQLEIMFHIASATVLNIF